ncbi:MAG: hypothetical protein H6741_03605 [Alphaproteobacteria bacterium]|nr:hypothetical protein [Alphaproteobacteria bacterium]MCB9791791.1 hypothetical protein [Alphaproteobacteria bacterium]
MDVTQAQAWLERALRQPANPTPLEAFAEERFIEVKHGAVRALHAPGEGGARPLVFIPGFGAGIRGWQDFYGLVLGQVELYVIETLEKKTTRLGPEPHDLSPEQMARDMGEAIRALGLEGQDYVMMGSCWGATLMLVGALAGDLSPPTLATYDPMHAMYFNKLALRCVASHLPVGLIERLRAPLRDFMLRDMHEPTQRARSEAFINDADPYRWSRTAAAAWDLELYDIVGALQREVLVFNGSHDAVHDSSHYPRLAQAMPGGRFFHMPVDESDRERLAAVVSLALASVSADEALPEALLAFEQP